MSMHASKTMIIIAGPTAVGKTAVAIEVAKKFGTEIVSADSRQCYKELNIGVVRPSPAELAQVPHHFIASHSIHEKITAAFFEEYALQKVHGLFKKFDVVVMTGGTGLYLKAFCEGLDAIPAVPESLHQQVINEYQKNGLGWLQQEVQRLDPLFFSKGETKNPQRLMRALEVFKATGQSIETFKNGSKAVREFNIIKTALQLPREQLYRNINLRTDAMRANGLVNEVKALIPCKHLNALQTVGYNEIFEHLDEMISLDEAVERIKKNTRHYAKRQLTWFRNTADYRWFAPDPAPLIHFLQKELAT